MLAMVIFNGKVSLTGPAEESLTVLETRSLEKTLSMTLGSTERVTINSVVVRQLDSSSNLPSLVVTFTVFVLAEKQGITQYTSDSVKTLLNSLQSGLAMAFADGSFVALVKNDISIADAASSNGGQHGLNSLSGVTLEDFQVSRVSYVQPFDNNVESEDNSPQHQQRSDGAGVSSRAVSGSVFWVTAGAITMVAAVVLAYRRSTQAQSRTEHLPLPISSDHASAGSDRDILESQHFIDTAKYPVVMDRVFVFKGERSKS
jgi:hypothetical protein